MRIGNSVKNKSDFMRIPPTIYRTILLLLVALFSLRCSEEEVGKEITFDGTTMGTTYSIKIIQFDHQLNETDLKTKIDSLLKFINMQMSTYIPNSEISAFNSSYETEWTNVSSNLAMIISEAKKLAEKSNNAYDITVGPIINLWGFGPEDVPLVVPSSNSIEKAKRRTGIDKIEVDEESSRIKKLIPDLSIDLSSVAKGFGVDRVAELLEDEGIDNYMVEIGGEVRTSGSNVKNNHWRIGISTPVGNKLQKIISISGVSVATSGDYLNYFEKEGVRYSHLINPLTGRPISHNLASVTVIDDYCRTADAYATAINVMGPEKGYEFAAAEKLPVFMIVREGKDFIEKMTPEFKEFIEEVN